MYNCIIVKIVHVKTINDPICCHIIINLSTFKLYGTSFLTAHFKSSIRVPIIWGAVSVAAQKVQIARDCAHCARLRNRNMERYVLHQMH